VTRPETSSPPAGWRIPPGYEFLNLGECRGCGAPIAWARTPTGRQAPLEREGINHFASCPEADRFRRERRFRG
jgi:hypothetical protein